MGCVLMVASPLYWYNYNAFLLIPIAWLLLPARGERASAWLAAVALLLLSVPWIEAIAAAGWIDALSFSWRYAWSPLIVAALVRVVRGSALPRSPEA